DTRMAATAISVTTKIRLLVFMISFSSRPNGVQSVSASLIIVYPFFRPAIEIDGKVKPLFFT
ncbi:MAG: hypothetical protein ACM3MB_08725, partial [Acidobacteriota bacterium]